MLYTVINHCSEIWHAHLQIVDCILFNFVPLYCYKQQLSISDLDEPVIKAYIYTTRSSKIGINVIVVTHTGSTVDEVVLLQGV